MPDALISLVLIVFSVGYLALTARLPATVGATVGPKAFPLLVGALLIAACVVLLWRSLRRTARDGGSPHSPVVPDRPGNLASVVGAAIAYLVVLKFIGYVLATFLFLATVLNVWNRGRALLNLGIAAGSALCAYLLISLVKISLPVGALGLP